MEPSVFQEVCRLLEQETLLFRSIAATEIEKRRHILTANGRKLQELTRKTEILLAETEALSGRRSQLSSKLLADNPKEARDFSLSEMVDRAMEAGMAEAERFREVAARYRTQIGEVQGEVGENDRLLGLAGQSIRRLVHGLQTAAGRTETYRPHSEENKRRAQSVIVNANA